MISALIRVNTKADSPALCQTRLLFTRGGEQEEEDFKRLLVSAVVIITDF